MLRDKSCRHPLDMQANGQDVKSLRCSQIGTGEVRQAAESMREIARRVVMGAGCRKSRCLVRDCGAVRGNAQRLRVFCRQRHGRRLARGRFSGQAMGVDVGWQRGITVGSAMEPANAPTMVIVIASMRA